MMDEEMKNAEQAADDVKKDAGSILDQLKGMLDEATTGEGNVFEKTVSLASLTKPRTCLMARMVRPVCLTNSRR